MPYAQYLGGLFCRINPSVKGIKKPDASPLANCKLSNIGRSVEKRY